MSTFVIAATTTVAVAWPVMSAISRDGHRRRHYAALDEGQAHPHPQQKRQEQNSRPMPGPAVHDAAKVATSAAINKMVLNERSRRTASGLVGWPLLRRQHQ